MKHPVKPALALLLAALMTAGMAGGCGGGDASQTAATGKTGVPSGAGSEIGDTTGEEAFATSIATDASGGTVIVTVPRTNASGNKAPTGKGSAGKGDGQSPTDQGGSVHKTTTTSKATAAAPSLTLYAAPSSLPAALRNTDYTFQVKGGGKDWQTISAYNVKIDPDLPANKRTVDGSNNTIEPKVQNSPLISFALNGTAEVSITKNRGTFQADKVKVYPESLNIRPTVSGNKLTFTMNGAQKLAVSLDGSKTNMAYVMASEPAAAVKAQKTFSAGVTTLPMVGEGVWNGTIRDLYMYQMTLTEAMIEQLRTTDTIPMDGKAVLKKKYTQTLTFDGTDDYFDDSYYYNTAGQYSVSAKVMLKADTDQNPGLRAIMMGALYRRSDGTLASNIGGWESPYITNEKLPADGKEHHVVLVKSGQTVTIYIDGKACTAQNGSDRRPSDTESVQFWTVVGANQLINAYYAKDNETIYLAPGAVVRGTIYVQAADHVKICGPGMIDIGTVTNDINQGFNFNTQRGIVVSNAKSVVIEDVTVNNSYSFSVHLRESSGVTIDNLKVFSHYSATDGVNIKACSNVAIRDSFIRANDDSISIYASNDNAIGSSSKITVEGSTLASDAAHAIFTGIHADPGKSETISGLTFRDIDVIQSRTPGDPYYGVFGVNAGDNVTVKDVLFENIRVSSQSNQQLLNVRVMMNSAYNLKPGLLVDGVTFRNISYTGSALLKSVVSGNDASHLVKNITFDTVTVNGTKWTAGNASTHLSIGHHVAGVQYK